MDSRCQSYPDCSKGGNEEIGQLQSSNMAEFCPPRGERKEPPKQSTIAADKLKQDSRCQIKVPRSIATSYMGSTGFQSVEWSVCAPRQEYKLRSTKAIHNLMYNTWKRPSSYKHRPCVFHHPMHSADMEICVNVNLCSLKPPTPPPQFPDMLSLCIVPSNLSSRAGL